MAYRVFLITKDFLLALAILITLCILVAILIKLFYQIRPLAAFYYFLTWVGYFLPYI